MHRILIIASKPFSKLGRSHSDDGIDAGIEVGRPVENLNANQSFLERLVARFQAVLDDVIQKFRLAFAVCKKWIGEHPVQLVSNSILIGGRTGQRNLGMGRMVNLELLDCMEGHNPPQDHSGPNAASA